MRQLLLGIDVGTTYCKALVLDAEGAELGEARERTPWTPVPTGAELDPRAIASTALAVAARALAESPAGAVAAVGVAGMGETGVLLDRSRRAGGPGHRVARRPRARTRRGRSRPRSAGPLRRADRAARLARCAR